MSALYAPRLRTAVLACRTAVPAPGWVEHLIGIENRPLTFRGTAFSPGLPLQFTLRDPADHLVVHTLVALRLHTPETSTAVVSATGAARACLEVALGTECLTLLANEGPMDVRLDPTDLEGARRWSGLTLVLPVEAIEVALREHNQPDLLTLIQAALDDQLELEPYPAAS